MAKGINNKNKTHCPQGHPYDEENTIIDGASRKCRICKRSKAQARYRAQKLAAADRLAELQAGMD
jgi:hypothetical protein